MMFLNKNPVRLNKILFLFLIVSPFCFLFAYETAINLQTSPEEKAIETAKRYLLSRGEGDRIKYVKCFRIPATENDRLVDVSFYIGCKITEPSDAPPISVAVAFGSRGQVQFSDISREP